MQVVPILDADELLRRFVRANLNSDGTLNSNTFKISGKPSSNTPVAMRQSVDLAKMTTPAESAARRPNSGIGVLTAAVPRAQELAVEHAPLDENPAHSVLDGGFTKAICHILADATLVVLEPPAS